jgi:hypothetical protein
MGVAGSQPMNTVVHRGPNKLWRLWRSNSIFNLWYTVYCTKQILWNIVFGLGKLCDDLTLIKDPRNRFQGIDSASLRIAWRWRASTTTLFLLGPSPKDCSEIPAQYTHRMCVSRNHGPTFGAGSLFVKKSPSFWPIQTGKGNMCFKWKLQAQILNKHRASKS